MSAPTSSPWSDLERPPLSEARLRRALVDHGGWRRIAVVGSTGSTNADMVDAAASGEPAGLVLIAEEQDAGRGRLDRQWQAPARSSVLLSALLRPTPPPARWPLLPLMTGLAAVEALRSAAEVPAGLKWPNDLMVGGRKLGGILVQLVDTAVVIGIGINVSTRPEELAVPTATSIAIAGGVTDRETIVKELLRALRRRYDDWARARGAPESVLPAYREVCETIGRQVRVELPAGLFVTGTAQTVDDEGRLVVATDDGAERAFTVGDIVHVRPDED